LKFLATIIAALTFSTFASAFEFGTKFACCRAQSVSCLGGGGATVWSTTLKDRALTQVDAKARCGFDHMYWATHSCPASTQCNPDPTPPTTQYDINFRNQTANPVFLALKTWSGNTYQIRAWFEVKANQARKLVYRDEACLAISQFGRDYIADKQASGSIFTGTISNLKAHPQRRTDLDFGLQAAGKYWVTLFVDGIFAKKTYTGYSADNVRALMDQNGLTSFKCHQTKRANFIVSAD
jgi:hypothetical protein